MVERDVFKRAEQSIREGKFEEDYPLMCEIFKRFDEFKKLRGEEMLDKLGNEVDKVTEHSIQMRAYVMGNKLDRAIWGLAKACIGKRTKEQIKDAINEASKLIIEVRQELIGK